jgi:ABC-type nitrate/sulfonate/bicarbonate transport system permease component
MGKNTRALLGALVASPFDFILGFTIGAVLAYCLGHLRKS